MTKKAKWALIANFEIAVLHVSVTSLQTRELLDSGLFLSNFQFFRSITYEIRVDVTQKAEKTN
jgi:hypothetical protein